MSNDRCWCCGLGNVTGSLCGHCKDAGCNRFDDYCKAAEMENPNLGGSGKA